MAKDNGSYSASPTKPHKRTKLAFVGQAHEYLDDMDALFYGVSAAGLAREAAATGDRDRRILNYYADAAAHKVKLYRSLAHRILDFGPREVLDTARWRCAVDELTRLYLEADAKDGMIDSLKRGQRKPKSKNKPIC